MAILFDLDGTLVDTAGDILAAINNLCIEYDHAIADQVLLRNNTSFGLKKLLSIALNTDINNLEDDQVAELTTKFRYLYKETEFAQSVLFPGIQELLANLKKHNFKIAVVTNKHCEFANPILKKLKLLEYYVDFTITADMVKHPKPHPESVLLAINKLQTVPDKCLFIGDAEQDIVAGRLAGAKTVVASYGYIDPNVKYNDWHADHSVNNPTEIWPLIAKLYLSS